MLQDIKKLQKKSSFRQSVWKTNIDVRKLALKRTFINLMKGDYSELQK